MEAVANQAEINSKAEMASRAWLIVAAAALRTAFGVLMAIDAYLKWKPGFAAHYVGYLQNAAALQPRWLEGWFHMWLRLVAMNTGFFISATRFIETAIAIGLLLGLARRATYFVGALFSLLIWATAGGFGGPYTAGATNLGPALIYALVFMAAALFEHLLGRNPYSLDYYISRRYPKWASLMEWAPKRPVQPPPALD
jgi:nitrite reductase (NO-forming)